MGIQLTNENEKNAGTEEKEYIERSIRFSRELYDQARNFAEKIGNIPVSALIRIALIEYMANARKSSS